MAPGSFILGLADCRESDIVGGKAINLARLVRAGFGVPPGFVVTTHAFRAAAAGGGKMPQEVADAVTQAYRHMGSPSVAVRSSATAEDMAGTSMAGQYETFLDVRGEQDVLEAVRKCWASIGADRVQAYLREHDIDPAIVAMAVVVQELIPAEIAGVLFTANPRTGSRNEMLIEASWGLGESVVSGIVQPDTLVIDRATGAVKESVISDKRVWVDPQTGREGPVDEARRRVSCLHSEDVRSLWKLGLQVIEHFGSAQDLEWAIHEGRLYLLQSRPVTTLEDAEAYEQLLQETRAQLRAWKHDGLGDWVRHSISETLPHPTPLTWSVIRRFMSGDGGFGAMYKEVGFEPSPDICRNGFLERIGGRIYMDLSRAPGMFFEGFPFEYDVELVLSNPDAAQGPPTIPSGSARERGQVVRKLVAVNARLEELAADYDEVLDRETIPAFVEYVQAEKKKDLRDLSTHDWLALWRDREKRVMDTFAPQSLLPSLMVGMAMQKLHEFVRMYFWEEDPDELVNLLSVGDRPDVTMLAIEGMYELAQGTRSLDNWLEEHGHRAPEEFDLAAPRWRERRDALETMAGRLKSGERPLAMHDRRVAKAQQRVAELEAELGAAQRDQFRRHISLLHRYMRFREDGKHYLMMGYDLLSDMAKEAGRRLEVGEEIFLLSFEELQDALTTGFAPLHLIEQRRVERAAELRLTLPHVITESDIATLGDPAKIEGAARQEALPISTGARTGPARIVQAPDEAGDLGRDYILICPSTDPSWTPLFVNAAGLVMECGGSLSHGAVVAREMGIPAVVLPGATRLFEDGESITVDGRNGAILRGGEGEAPALPGPEEVDPSDVRIAPELVPPPPGPRERTCAKVRNLFLGIWALYFAWVFLLPGTWIYDKTIALLDAILWPLYRALDGPAAVAVIAAVFGTVTMVAQRFLTDNKRLRVAKQRAAALRKQAVKLPKEAPRRAAMLQLAGPVQIRVLMAAILPLAIILGPLVMSFLWLPARVAPVSRSPRPGWDMTVTARVDREHVRRAWIETSEGVKIHGEAHAVKQIPPIRDILMKQVLPIYEDAPDVSNLPPMLQMVEQWWRRESERDLRAYLRRPIPPGEYNWSIATPEQPRRSRVTVVVQAVVNSEEVTQRMGVEFVTGEVEPPEPMEIVTEKRPIRGELRDVSALAYVARADQPNSLIEWVHVVPIIERTKGENVFWAPVEWLHQLWPDMLAGWLIVYIAVYLVLMLALKFGLRIA